MSKLFDQRSTDIAIILYLRGIDNPLKVTIMKLLVLPLMAFLAVANTAWAQDDVYFVPTKKALQQEKQQTVRRYNYETYPQSDDTFEYDDWADGRSNGSRDVDEYNRRQKSDKKYRNNDYSADYYDVEEQNMTGRIVRFRSPRGVIIASPYYYDYYYDLAYYDPWFSNWGWNRWYGWYDPFYVGFGWGYSPWRYSSWYSPWYSGWGYSWYGGWGWKSWYSPYYYGYYGWGGYHGWHHYGYNSFGRYNGVYYGSMSGSNNTGYTSRGGSFAGRNGGSMGTRGGSFSDRNGSRGSSFDGNSRGYSRGNANYNNQRNDFNLSAPSRRGNIVNNSRNGSNSGNSYTPSRSQQNSNSNSNSYTPSRNGNSFNSGSSRGGGFNSGGSFNSRGGSFNSGGGSSRGGGIVGGRR